jgi:hypothetical protein
LRIVIEVIEIVVDRGASNETDEDKSTCSPDQGCRAFGPSMDFVLPFPDLMDGAISFRRFAAVFALSAMCSIIWVACEARFKGFDQKTLRPDRSHFSANGGWDFQGSGVPV